LRCAACGEDSGLQSAQEHHEVRLRDVYCFRFFTMSLYIDAFVGIFMYCNYLAAEIWRAAATT
jgi:hypothetical protein